MEREKKKVGVLAYDSSCGWENACVTVTGTGWVTLCARGSE